MDSLLEDKEQRQPQTVEEEYALWKKNSTSMYEFVSETKLGWPSMAIEWLGTADSVSQRQELLVGTLTDKGDEDQSINKTNYLKFCKLDYPSGSKAALKVFKKFEHEGEINKIKVNPLDSDIIATINDVSVVNIFDRKKGLVATFSGAHSQEDAFGLSFNSSQCNILASAATDGKCVLWDTQKNIKFTESQIHSQVVNSIEFSPLNANIIVSVSDDRTIAVNDIRTMNQPQKHVSIDTKSVFNALSLSPFSQNLLACAGEDSMVHLFDLRYMSNGKTLHQMAGHEGNITNLDFAKYKDGILVSSAEDRSLIYWDLTKIGNEQTPDDAEDGVPEKLFVHGGHRSGINDFSLHPTIPWLTASTEEENYTQIYRPTEKITNPEWMGDINIDDME
ncbi:hypothetical protein QEN19_000273 [Hanseniaspora menglaensis]